MQRIFGPPGTGKTTTLLNLVDRALSDNVPSNQIAFFAFTRKAATEAKERAAERFGLNPKEDLPFFRTIHSLAFFFDRLEIRSVDDRRALPGGREENWYKPGKW